MSIQSELADLIRSKPDAELLALVVGSAPQEKTPARVPGQMVKKENGRAKTLAREAVFEQQVAAVMATVQSNKGVGGTAIAEATSLPRSHVMRALTHLREQGQVFQGGERKFARYATSQEAADDASIAARGK